MSHRDRKQLTLLDGICNPDHNTSWKRSRTVQMQIASLRDLRGGNDVDYPGVISTS
ncbi:MAG: hypothetical protein GWP11_06610 [Proteobacteria bacterium]|nr:hypothetical protein [Pseudomonadota bacterium]